MEAVLSDALVKNYDPTHTTVLRNAFAKDMKRRFTELAKVVRKAVDTEDCFMLRNDNIQTHQMTTPVAGAFNFEQSAAKLEAFMKWLQVQVDRGVLDIGIYEQIGSGVYSEWTNLYIYDSYKRGVMRARYELKKAGLDIPSIEDSGGINAIMELPFHVDRVGLLFTRVYNDLKGITTAMDMQISRVLAQGMADGDGPALLARKLVATINGTGMGDLAIKDTLGRFIPAMDRAMLLARTEIIRSFAEATLQEFKNWGVEGVSAKAEWSTAGDDRVCKICQPLEGRVFTLDEASGLIPAHPNCRCAWLPYIPEVEKIMKDVWN